MRNHRMLLMSLLCVLTIGGSVGLFMYGNQIRSEIRQMEELLNEESQQQTVIQETQLKTDDTDFAGILEDCKNLGEKVLTNVNAYQSVSLDGVTPNSDEYNQIVEKARNVVAELESCFTEGIDVSSAWYQPKDYKDFKAVWQMEPNLTFDGKTIPVLWTCRDVDNRILAYTMADYKISDKVFGTPTVVITSYGYQHTAVTLENGITAEEVYGQDLLQDIEDSKNSIFDAIENNKVDPIRDLTPEEEDAWAAANQQRDQLREQYEKGQKEGNE